jgi:acyl-coenzyme A thioesterase 13
VIPGSGTPTRMPSPDVPDGFRPLADAGAFLELVGPVHVNDAGVLGIRVEDRHLNRAGSAMGGFLATLVDVALGQAIRQKSDGDAQVATVSLTTDYLRAGKSGAWLEAHTDVERLGGTIAFADCSVRADGEEVVRARAVFAVRTGG